MKIIAIISILLLTIIGSFFVNKDIKNIFTKKENITENTNSGNIIKKENSIDKPKEDETRDKISILRKRFSVKGIILKGDYYSENNQPLFALTKYLQALKQTPDDKKILSKIADTYFELKKFRKAYTYYNKAKNYSNTVNKNLIKSLLYTYAKNLNTENINKIKEEINLLKISNEERFYYTTSILCLEDFHKCKKDFGMYIEENKDKLETQEILDIKKQIEIYNNFGVDNLYYKDSLITASFYKNGLYPIGIILGKNILKKKTNYKSILLVIGKSYYELGYYDEAKEYLGKSYEIDPENKNITYLLGIISFKQKDYISSNLYYNSAIKNGYSPKIDLERRLVYNYFLLGDKDGMLNVFKYIIKEDNVNVDDISLGIYHAINQDKLLTAIDWANIGLKKFPKEEIFLGYLGWAYRLKGDIVKSTIYLQRGLRKNPRNPLLTLNMGYLLEKQEKYEKALEYFKTTVSANDNGEFGELAKKEIELINKYLETTKEEKIN